MSHSQGIQVLIEPTPKMLRTLFNLGHLSLVTMLGVWALAVLLKGDPYDTTWQIILLTIFFGRAAAVSAGTNMDFNPLFLFYQASIADIFLVLYIFPAFVRSYQRLTGVRFISGYLERLHTVALGYKTRVAPYGIAGLLIFVIYPFWSTGPLVGAIIGYLLGLPTLATLITVIIGNTLAVAGWVWFYDALHDWNETLAMVLLIAIFALAIGGLLAGHLHRAKKKRASKVLTAGESIAITVHAKNDANADNTPQE